MAQPKLVPELKAMVREAVKDIRETVMETFVNSPEQTSEPGVPMNPTMQEVTDDRKGKGAEKDSFVEKLKQYEPQQEAGREMETGREM